MNDEKLQALAAAREAVELAKNEKYKMVLALEESPAYKAILEQIAAAESEASRLDEEIRTEAIAEFKATGTKQPHEKVSIALYSIVKPYNEATAREWCFSNFRPALTLDKKSFEKAVTSGQIPDSIAQSDSEPRVKIAKQL